MRKSDFKVEKKIKYLAGTLTNTHCQLFQDNYVTGMTLKRTY